MNPLTNQKGIALVTSLMLTMISLTIVMYLLYMVTSGVKLSGASKRYKTALEASYGMTDLVMKEIIPTMFSSSIAAGTSTPTTALNALYGSSLHFTAATDVCMMEKLTKPASQWTIANCGNITSTNPKDSPDFSMQLNSTGTDPFTVYAKIVESMCSDKRPYPTGKCTGSDLSGVDYLDGGQGTTGGSAGVNVQAMPATFRIEVRGERSSNAVEKSNISVLYAY